MNIKKMNLPIVCDMSVFQTEDRKSHENKSMKITKDAKRVIELEDGFAFHHDYHENHFIEIATWMTQENKCCPFFTFELVIEPFESGRETVLRLKGNESVKAYLQNGLKQLQIDLKD